MAQVLMVFSDVDGTLVGADHHAIPQSGPTIRAVAERVPVCLVSARSPEGLYPIQRDLGFSGPLACYSGAYVLDDAGAELFSTTFPVSLAERVKDIVAQEWPQVVVGTYGFHDWVVDDRSDSRVQNEEFLVQAQARECSDLAGTFGERGVHKMLLMGEQDDIMRAERTLSERFGELNVVRSSKTLCEIMTREADKGRAVALLCDRYDVDPAQAIAFGDGPNDVDMLQAAGVSCAMANAEPSVREVATRTLPWTNEECGVARELERLFLQA